MSRNNGISIIDTGNKNDVEDLNISSERNVKSGNFDAAVTAAGYGKFHFLLYFAIIPVSWASSFDTTNMSMIFSSAECDLNLSLFHKGVLNSSVYVGMVLSGILWGYLADVKGRRSILVYGFMADGVCNVLAGFSQNFWTLACFKFISGLIISGPHATVIAYYSEFYRTEDRAKITLLVAFSIVSGSVINAALAWLVIPQDWSFVLWDGYFVYNSWRMFLSLCGVPTLIGCLCIRLFPESPKFLMSQGKNDEALKVFQRIYKMNSGQSTSKFPIHVLEDESQTKGNRETPRSSLSPKKDELSLKNGLRQMKAIFRKTHLLRLLLVITMQFSTMFALNTIRLWQPQLFTIVANTDSFNDNSTDDSLSFCEILDSEVQVDKDVLDDDVATVANCTNFVTTSAVYTDTVIISTATVILVLTASTFINCFGHRNILYITYGISISCMAFVSWSTSGLITLILTALFIGLLSTTANMIVGVAVLLFPTTLRTMAVCLVMVSGRCGALIGNLVFPIILAYGCTPAIIMVACLPLGGILLTCFIPNTKKQNTNNTSKSQ